jgi:hypothetical protein
MEEVRLMGFRRDCSYVEEGRSQVQHPDRVAWYTALIEQWTTQVPHVAVIDAQTVAAWIGSYSSVVGVRHYGSTQAWASSVEEALEGLCTWVYEDLQTDLWSVQSARPVAVAGEVQVEGWEPWIVNLR